MVTVVSGAASMGSKTSTWELRPILWFASAYTVSIILHERAHAVAAYALGFPSMLFNFWVNPDLTRATMNERAAVGIAGPAFSLCFGTLCWLTYRRVRESAAAMPLAYLSAFGLSIFFGNLMSASFVGDFSDAAMVLDLPRTARHLASFAGALLSLRSCSWWDVSCAGGHLSTLAVLPQLLASLYSPCWPERRSWFWSINQCPCRSHSWPLAR